MPAPPPRRGKHGERAAGPVAVLTDTAAALPVDWQQRFAASGPFACVELPVLIDGAPAPPGPGNPLRALHVALAEGRPVTTSRPSPARLRTCYERFRDAGCRAVVSVHLSGALSGTVAAGRAAREGLGIPVRLVDTRSAGLGQGLAVRAAVRAARAGHGCEDVAAAAAAAAGAARILLRVPTLETLRRGGRLGFTPAGAAPRASPLLSLRDGELVAVGPPVPRAEARARLLRLAGAALARARPAAPVLGIHHVGDPAGARELGQALLRHRPSARLEITELPPVLSAHVGLGAQAAVVEGPARHAAGRGARPAPRPR